MNGFQEVAATVGGWLDVIGVIVILTGFILSTMIVAARALQTHTVHHLFRMYRQDLARSILVGLEFLVAGDIIRTVAGQLSFDSVIILTIIVLVRSLLSVEYEMEVDGFWPWQRAKMEKKKDA